MWILPKQLHTSAFVPDTEALISDLAEQSQICGQSLLVRSKPSPARTWSLKWKRDSWTALLSGRILKPSLGMDFLARWTSSLEGSPVNHSVVPESAMETKTHATSFPTFWTALEDADLPLFSLRTLKESSPQSSQETTGEIQQESLFCSMSLGNWNGWVTKHRQAYSLRLKSAYLTRESGSSSWPTANARDWKDSVNSVPPSVGQTRGHSLGMAVAEKNWPTPTTGEHLDQGTNWETLARLDKGGRILRRIATVSKQSNDATWPTPIQGDAHLASTPEAAQRRIAEGKTTLSRLAESGLPDLHNHSTHGSRQESYLPLSSQSIHVKGTTGKLNPRWVETLMGLPVGWVMPSCVNPITPIAEPSQSIGEGNWMTPEAQNSTGYQVSNGKKILRLGSQVMETSTPPVTIEQTNSDSSETELFQQPQNSPLELFGQNFTKRISE